MKRMIKIVVCLGALLYGTGIAAQTIERQVIASGGSVQSASGVAVSSTVGETVTATFSSGTVILTQGFQQDGLTTTSLSENKIAVDYKLYPNPTQNQLNINLIAEENIEGVLKLTSIDGKLIHSKRIRIEANQPFKDRFNMEHLPEGLYILSIQSEKGESQVVEKVQKIN